MKMIKIALLNVFSGVFMYAMLLRVFRCLHVCDAERQTAISR